MGEKKIAILLRERADGKDAYEDAFGTLGFSSVFVQVLRTEICGEDALRAVLDNVDKYVGMIVTSQRAVEAIGRVCTNNVLDAWRCKRIYAVGKSTQRALTGLGLDAQTPQAALDGGADGLAQAVVADGLSGKFVFVAGESALDSIENGLRSAGGDVERIHVYRTAARDPSDVCADVERAVGSELQVVCVCVFSPSGSGAAASVVGCLQQRQHVQMVVAAIGKRTEASLAPLGIPIVVAKHPDAVSLADAVKEILE